MLDYCFADDCIACKQLPRMTEAHFLHLFNFFKVHLISLKSLLYVVFVFVYDFGRVNQKINFHFYNNNEKVIKVFCILLYIYIYIYILH